jgi:hypothetical protein
MRGLHLLCFILFLPLAAAVGHDLYMAYNANQAGSPVAFQLSDLGWLWTTYAPENFQWVKSNADSDFWVRYIDPILEQPAALVAAVPFVLSLIAVIAGKFVATGQGLFFRRGSDGNFSFREGEEKKRAKYKRK